MGNAQIGDRLAQLIGDEKCPFGRGVGQEGNELLAAVARQEVTFALEFRRRCTCNLLQAAVARLVPVPVVLLLEMIDIDHQQRQRTFFSRRSAPLDVQGTVEVPSICDPEQAVLVG